MKKIPLGVQLYSVREDAAKDLACVLAAIKKMGYDAVEFAGYYGHSAQDIRKLLDDNGLLCCGTHTKLDTLLGDELPRTIEFNQSIGNKYLIVPWMPEERRKTREGWLQCARLFAELADQVKPHGQRVGYHNHHFEFTPLDGELPWDTFFGNTKPEVIMQLDTANAMLGGGDPVPFLSRYPGRATTVHLKEFSKTNNKAVLGEGDVKWNEIFNLCETKGGTEWYIVEQEAYATAPLDCIARCLENLRKMGK